MTQTPQCHQTLYSTLTPPSSPLTPAPSPITPAYSSCTPVHSSSTPPEKSSILLGRQTSQPPPNCSRWEGIPTKTILQASRYKSPSPELPTWSTESIAGESQDLESLRFAKYGLREAARDSSKLFRGTWMDQDATGNYDPKSKCDPGLKPPADCIPRRRRERPEGVQQLRSDKIKNPNVTTWRRGRFEGRRLCMTFRFSSDHGLGILRSWGTEFDNWPQSLISAENLDSEWEAWWSDSIKASELIDPLESTYALRKRTGLESPTDSTECYDLAEITLGHPAARGCKACWRLRLTCPLLQEGCSYPCLNCAEDGMDCELVLQPVEKRSCEACRKRRTVCSYTIKGSDHTASCQQCNNIGQRCIAGPKSGRTRVGPSYDAIDCLDSTHGFDDFDIHPQQSRIGSGTKRKESRKDLCQGSDIDADYDPYSSRTKRCRKNGKRLRRSPSEESLIIAPSKPSNKPVTKVIITSLANPVHFNYQATEESGGVQCHWCEDPVYGILGLGEREVEVIDYKDGNGLVEIFGGFLANGYPASRMCEMCTLTRIMIVACKNHELEPIAGIKLDDYGDGKWMEWMMPGKAASAPFSWCSACPAPASFQCCKKMDMDVNTSDVAVDTDSSDTGCGLLLCDACAGSLEREHEGVLGLLLDALKGRDRKEAFGLRADADFLHPDGELMRRMDTLMDL